MRKQKFFTKNDDFEWVEIDEEIANDVLNQYFEKKYFGAIVIASFIIGFLCGVIAYAL